jgi:ATP-binding cassette subfamily C (CFTR/MRP) protein 1
LGVFEWCAFINKTMCLICVVFNILLGAGKSSLTVSLFRFVESDCGSIEIDGINIANIGLTTLRKCMGIIPQDPLLYSGTFRTNLDPFNQYSDKDLWLALDKCYLSDTVKKLELQLQSPIHENGSNLSNGQRAQISLARAMLNNPKILIIDEATASIDLQTDNLIQASIKKHFHCTMLTIAHRINTIIDYDKIIVMDNGQIKEFDTPANLLADNNSLFTSLVNNSGQQSQILLKQTASKRISNNYYETSLSSPQITFHY